MPSEFSIYDSGWKSIYDAHVRVGTEWKRIEDGWVYTSGGWKQFFVYDITGPGAAGSLQARWFNGFGVSCYVSWTQPTATDLDYTLLQKSTNGGSTWTTIATKSEGPGVAVSYADTAVTLSAYTVHNAANQASAIHKYRVIPYDTRGNVGTSVSTDSTSYNGGVARGYLSSPYYFNSSDSQSWLAGNAYWAAGVSQGYQTSFGNGRRYGHFFYDNSTSHTLNVDNAQIAMKRGSAFGNNSAIPVGTRGSTAASASGDPVPSLVGGTTFSGSYVYGTFDWATVSADNAQYIVANLFNSIVIDAEQTSGNNSSYFSDWADHLTYIGYGVSGGALRIYHTG